MHTGHFEFSHFCFWLVSFRDCNEIRFLLAAGHCDLVVREIHLELYCLWFLGYSFITDLEFHLIVLLCLRHVWIE